MSALLESVAWNSLVALTLAAFVLTAGRIWKRPELLHVLWLVVLLKLVTPGVIRLAAFPDVLATELPVLAVQSTGVPLPAETAAALPAIVMAGAPVQWTQALAVVWIGGSLLFLLLVGFQCLRFARVMRSASPPGRALGERVAVLAARIGVAVPRTRVLDATVPPLVWGGLRRSTLVLPSTLLGRLTAAETDTLITHELAHVKRRDPWIRYVELAVTAALWWNPLVWWVRRRLRHAEEQACDRRVLEMFPLAQRAYADGIVKTVEFLAGHDRTPQFATGAAGTRDIKERLTMILNPSVKSRLRHPLVPALLLALLALPIVPGFAERSDPEDDQARAALLELEREALELQQRLHEIQAERNEIHVRLGETRHHTEALEARRKVEELQRQGQHEQAAQLEAKLEQIEVSKAQHMAQRAEMMERERAMHGAELKMREAKIAFERARDVGDRSAAEDYERALADMRSRADDVSAAADYERVLFEHLRQRELAEHKVRAQLTELKIAFENAGKMDGDELEHAIEVLTQKLRELERKEQSSGVR